MVYPSTVEFHLSGLIWAAGNPYIKKIRIIGFFHSKYATLAVCSPAVTIYSMYLRLNLSTAPNLKL